MSDDLLGAYRIEKPPFLRQLAIDSFAAISTMHSMTAFMEMDVTRPLERIEALRAQGVRVSLFSHVVRSVAVALDECPQLNVVRHGRRLAYFEDVDVSVPVEIETGGGHYPLQLVIRRAQDKSAPSIYSEIAHAKAQYAQTGSLGAEDRWARRMMRVAGSVPRPHRQAPRRDHPGHLGRQVRPHPRVRHPLRRRSPRRHLRPGQRGRQARRSGGRDRRPLRPRPHLHLRPRRRRRCPRGALRRAAAGAGGGGGGVRRLSGT